MWQIYAKNIGKHFEKQTHTKSNGMFYPLAVWIENATKHRIQYFNEWCGKTIIP